MVMYTGLARVAKKTGYPVNETPLWKNAGHGEMSGCDTILIHHTAGSSKGSKDYNSYNTVKYGRPGLPGPLAQLGVGRNTGTVYVFAAGLAYHAGAVAYRAHGNSRAIGIEIENNGLGEKYSAKAYGSAVALAGELVMEFGLTINNIKGHKEVAIPKGRKPDPSFNMSTFRKDVQKYINKKSNPVVAKPKPVVVKPKPAPIQKEEDNTVSINLTPEQLEQLIEEASERGAEKALSKKTVAWRDTVSDEIKRYSLPDAVGLLSVLAGRELDRDTADEDRDNEVLNLLRNAEPVQDDGPEDSAPDAAPVQS